MEISQYKTLIFDCDGVVLDSNKVKTQAFYDTALVFGQDAAKRLVEYHIERGGVSRYKKLKWLLDNLTQAELVQSPNAADLDILLSNYAEEVYKGLRSCAIAEGLEELRKKTTDSTWLIVSGGDQSELRELFEERNIAHFFDGGIFGSPDTKEIIMNRERKLGNIISPAVFIGDSQYDYIATTNVGNIDFVFVTDWSEFESYVAFFENKKNIKVYKNISSLD